MENLKGLYAAASELQEMYDIVGGELVPDGLGHKHPVAAMDIQASVLKMAALLIECEDILSACECWWVSGEFPQPSCEEEPDELCPRCGLLARLAEFDQALPRYMAK